MCVYQAFRTVLSGDTLFVLSFAATRKNNPPVTIHTDKESVRQTGRVAT